MRPVPVRELQACGLCVLEQTVCPSLAGECETVSQEVGVSAARLLHAFLADRHRAGHRGLLKLLQARVDVLAP